MRMQSVIMLFLWKSMRRESPATPTNEGCAFKARTREMREAWILITAQRYWTNDEKNSLLHFQETGIFLKITLQFRWQLKSVPQPDQFLEFDQNQVASRIHSPCKLHDIVAVSGVFQALFCINQHMDGHHLAQVFIYPIGMGITTVFGFL